MPGIRNSIVPIRPYPQQEQPKERALSDTELKAVWNELDNHTSHVREVLRLIVLTGQRPGEVMTMEWSEIDFLNALWAVPAAKTKNRLSNVVPLSSQASRILERHRNHLELQLDKRRKRAYPAPESRYVFPNKRLIKQGQEPITYIRKATGRDPAWRDPRCPPSETGRLFPFPVICSSK